MILDFFFPFYSYIWGIKYSSIIRPWKWLFWDWLENGGGDRKQFYKSRLGDSDILPPWQSMRGKKWSPISDRLFFFVVTTHSWETDGETVETVSDFIFLGSKIPADGDCCHEIKRRLLLGRKVMTNLDGILKRQRHYFVNKGPSSQGYGFSSGHVWMWELDYKESWAQKNWCFWSVVLEKTLESPLDCKEIHLVHPKGDQSWVFIGMTDVEAETPILWPPAMPHVGSSLPDQG